MVFGEGSPCDLRSVASVGGVSACEVCCFRGSGFRISRTALVYNPKLKP